MDLVKFLVLKKNLLNRITNTLDSESLRKSRNDHHAKRAPRPCGLTIHTGIGCSYCCTYCYIYDMGFSSKVKPYPLKGIELVASLLINPYFVPTLHGTLLAFGSVTEPFLPETYRKTIEYLGGVYSYLKNPIQISTKAFLTEEQITEVLRASPRLSVLITLITLRKFKELEPLAPNPYMRLETASKMIKLGAHVSLFIRPIIPGVTDREIRDIFEIALSYNIRKAVLGSLRVTNRIIKNLRNLGIDLSTRLVTKPRGSVQVPIRSSDLKTMAKNIANKLGIEVYPSACAANIDAHGLSCAMCRLGPCGDLNKLPSIDESCIRELLKYMKIKFKQITVFNNRIEIIIEKTLHKNVLYHIISILTKRATYIHH